MRAEDAAAMLEIATDVGRGDRRTVAGEDRLRRDRVFKLGKNTLLERKPFRRRFEHKGGAVNGRRQPIVHCDPLQDRRIVSKKIDDRLQPLRQRGAGIRRRLK